MAALSGRQTALPHRYIHTSVTFLHKLSLDFRRLRREGIDTLYIITDASPLHTIPHAHPFVAFLHSRLSYVGATRENTSALFYQLGPGTGFEQVHYTSAWPMLLSLLRTLLPTVHLILMDHDTCLTCFWEVEELRHLVATGLAYEAAQPLLQKNHVWRYCPEGPSAHVPGQAAKESAIVLKQDNDDANAGLIIFAGDAEICPPPEVAPGQYDTQFEGAVTEDEIVFYEELLAGLRGRRKMKDKTRDLCQQLYALARRSTDVAPIPISLWPMFHCLNCLDGFGLLFFCGVFLWRCGLLLGLLVVGFP